MAEPNPNDLLERSMWDLFWLPPDVSFIDRPDLLVLHCPRPVSHLNAVLRTRAPAERLPELVREADALHSHCVSRWLVMDTIEREPLHAALDSAGYVAGDHHEARIAPVREFRPRPGANVTIEPVLTIEGLRDQGRVMERSFDTPMGNTPESLAKDLELCRQPNTRVFRFLARDRSGKAISSGSITTYPALRFGLMWGGCTVPEARGQGAYSAIVAARIEQARRSGIEFVGLYALSDTSAPIVARQGFQHWGEMQYWDRPLASEARADSTD